MHSTYFHGIFFCGFKETSDGEVAIPFDYDVMLQVLRIIHDITQNYFPIKKKSFEPEMLVRMYLAADYLECPLIRNLCIDHFRATLGIAKMSHRSQEGFNMETDVCGQIDFVGKNGGFASIKADNGRLYGLTDLETIKILLEHMERKEVVRVRFTAVLKDDVAIAKNLVMVGDETPVVPAAPPTTHHHVPQVSPALQQTAPKPAEAISIYTIAQGCTENGAAPIGFSLPAPSSSNIVQLRLHQGRPEASAAVAAQPAAVARKTDATQSVPKPETSSRSTAAQAFNGTAPIGSSSIVSYAFASAGMGAQPATSASQVVQIGIPAFSSTVPTAPPLSPTTTISLDDNNVAVINETGNERISIYVNPESNP